MPAYHLLDVDTQYDFMHRPDGISCTFRRPRRVIANLKTLTDYAH